MKCIALFLLLLSTTAFSKEKLPEKEVSNSWLIRKNVQFSKWIDERAQKLDHYLTGEKLVDKENTTRATFKGFGAYVEGGGTEQSANFDIALRLPNLEKQWQLKFSNYDEEEERGVQRTQLRRTGRERNYGTSIALFRKLGDVSTTFQPRLELRDPLEMSYIMRFESQFDQLPFFIKPKLELFADPNKGTGEFFQLETSMMLNETYSISLTNEEEYRDFENFFYVTHALSLGQRIKDNAGMSYTTSYYFTNRETYHLDQYSISASWSHQLYRNILHYSAGPYLDFSKSRNFKGRTGFTAAVELIF